MEHIENIETRLKLGKWKGRREGRVIFGSQELLWSKVKS